MDKLFNVQPYKSFLDTITNHHTLIAYEKNLRHFKEFLDSKHVHPFFATCDHLSEFATKKIAHYAPVYRLNHRAAVSAFYDYLITTHQKIILENGAEHRVEENPAKVFRYIKVTVPDLPPRALAAESREALVQSLINSTRKKNFKNVENTDDFKEIRKMVVCLLGFHCALRVAEIAQVEWNHFDFQGRMLNVFNGKGSKFRRVPISKLLVETLDRYRKLWQLKYGQQPSPFLFVCPEDWDKHLHPASIQVIAKKAYVDANLDPSNTVHVLRHSGLTQFYKITKDLVATAKMGGHKNTRTTMRYTAVAEEEMKEQHAKAF